MHDAMSLGGLLVTDWMFSSRRSRLSWQRLVPPALFAAANGTQSSAGYLCLLSKATPYCFRCCYW